MHMTLSLSLVSGASLGAGLMYFLDPDRGRRRRALVRAKGVRWSKTTRPTPLVPDRILTERVRAKLVLFSRHPSAIDVHVADGVVSLTGPVLEDEFDGICNATARISGVAQIFNRLERHQSPHDVPALQGPMEPKPGPRFALMQSNWSPAARMAAALMGAAALLYGLSQRTVGAATLAVSGLGLLVRSATNQEFARLLNLKIGSIGEI